nr:unnamed protein product [Digitaria exilis]
MAEPQPPSSPSCLEDLPDDTQRLILDRIPCPIDRWRMSQVCPAWRDMMRRQQSQLAGPLLQRPPPLPWLLLRAPFTVGGLVPSTRVACVLSGCRVHHYLNIVPPDARCFGSHKDAWLFLSTHQPSAHIALNIHTRDVCEFPRYLLRQTDEHVQRLVIHAAALSHSPEDQRCVGAAIVTSWRDPPLGVVADLSQRHRCVAFWRRDWTRALDFVPDGDGDAAMDAEDVIYLYHSGAFVFVTQGEHLRQCTPRPSSQFGANLLTPEWEVFHFRPRGGLCDQHVRARYLVVTKGELLMVVRFTPHPNQPTSMFKVFRSKKRDTQDADANFPVAEYPWAWSELDTLGDRILFVGHGCSRSYRTDEYPGFKGGIYFLDDGKFYDDEVIFGNGNVRRYPCSDNGKWSEGHVERCFPRPDPSDHSAPVWLLP